MDYLGFFSFRNLFLHVSQTFLSDIFFIIGGVLKTRFSVKIPENFKHLSDNILAFKYAVAPPSHFRKHRESFGNSLAGSLWFPKIPTVFKRAQSCFLNQDRQHGSRTKHSLIEWIKTFWPSFIHSKLDWVRFKNRESPGGGVHCSTAPIKRWF